MKKINQLRKKSNILNSYDYLNGDINATVLFNFEELLKIKPNKFYYYYKYLIIYLHNCENKEYVLFVMQNRFEPMLKFKSRTFNNLIINFLSNVDRKLYQGKPRKIHKEMNNE